MTTGETKTEDTPGKRPPRSGKHSFQMVYYPSPQHIQTRIHSSCKPEDLPISLETVYETSSLPMNPYLQDATIEKVVGRVAEVVA